MTVISSGTWPIDATATSGTELAAYLNELVNAIQTTQASASRPPAMQKGGVWAKTLGATDIALMFYDGTADHEIGSVKGGTVSFGGVAASASAPASPSTGDTWVDISAAGGPVLKIWDGTKWVGSGAATTATAPTSPTAGQTWMDTTTSTAPVLKVWNGTAWVAVSGDRLEFGGATKAQANATGVGIGVAAATATLDVDGTIKLDGNYPVSTNNVALGDTALESLTSGVNNSALGSNALQLNSTFHDNVAVGYNALLNTNQNANTAVGRNSMKDNTSGYINSAFGRSSLEANTTGIHNTALGAYSLGSNTTAGFNTAVGFRAGYNYVGAVGGNTFVGAGNPTAVSTIDGDTSCGGLITTGEKNTIIGAFNGNQGGLDIRTSSNNIVLSDGDGNPRVYVDSSGNLSINRVGSSGRFAVSGGSTHNSYVADIDANNASYSSSILRLRSDRAAATSYMAQEFHAKGVTRFSVLGNGDVQNTNNSYGAISDQKLKENIQDASSQWDDLKSLRVRNYSMIADDLDAPNKIGVVAQEVEAAGMAGLVSETPDRDKDGNELGTTTKHVKYSILYMKAIKALQEAMDRIETLEAKVTALENA